MSTSASELFDRFPRGYSQATFDGHRWGVTHAVGAGGRRRTLYAEQLGGTDVVSANLYITDHGEHLRPCEMPEARVLSFLTGATSVEPRSAGGGYWTVLRRRSGPLGLLDRIRWWWRIGRRFD